MKWCQIEKVQNGWIVRTEHPGAGLWENTDKTMLVFTRGIDLAEWIEYDFCKPEQIPLDATRLVS
jgi:hypothetical protein